MILGFAHLMIHAADADAAVERFSTLGWEPMDIHRNVASAPEKWPLMAMYPNRHDLVLLKGPVALEVVSHNTGSIDRPSRIILDEAQPDICLLVPDVELERMFMIEGLGFREADGDQLKLNSPLPQWRVSLSVRPTEDTFADPPLDLEGPSCLAFYSTDPQSDAQRLKTIGCRDCTTLFEIDLSGHRMSVLMLRSPAGVILELIKINKGEMS